MIPDLLVNNRNELRQRDLSVKMRQRSLQHIPEGGKDMSNALQTGNDANYLFSLIAQLPPPLRTHKIDSINFEVWRAKDMWNAKWNNRILHKLTGIARQSYGRYGDVPLFDHYDPKSVVYLVRVQNQVFFSEIARSLPIEEWLSVRFVPAHGEPLGTSDFDECMHESRSLTTEIKKKLFADADDFLEHIVTISKICGIHPYISAEYQGERHNIAANEKHRYTAICFALMNRQFFEDHPHYDLRYIAGLFRNELIEKTLTVRTSTMDRIPAFTPAYQILGYDSSTVIRLNRTASTYLFPSYFLRIDQLLSLFEMLVRERHLTLSMLSPYIPVTDSNQLLRLSHDVGFAIQYLRGLGSLLQQEVPLGAESTMTGLDLRQLIDMHVEDGPQLQLMEAAKWLESTQHFFLPYRLYTHIQIL